MVLNNSITPLFQHSTAPPFHITPSLHNSIALAFHYSAISSLHYSITPLLYYFNITSFLTKNLLIKSRQRRTVFLPLGQIVMPTIRNDLQLFIGRFGDLK